MDPILRSEIAGTAALWLALGAAAILTWRRGLVAARVEERRRTAAIFAVGLLVHALHAGEEYATAFHEQFPPVLGLAPWPREFFVAFNAGWFAIWLAAAFALRAGYGLALIPVWFFAIACVMNGVAHPLLALRAGGYFPGLVTSPLAGIMGIWLFTCLKAVTEPQPIGARWRTVFLALEAVGFTLLVPGSVLFLIPRLVFGIWGDTFPSPWTARHVAALLPLGLGLAIYLRCLWEFAARGRGIPAPVDHPKHLVVTGLYRYVRNPMYAGVPLALLGESLFFGSRPFLLYTACWLAIVHLNVVLYEEPNLRRRFGDAYTRYTSAVGRWVPGRRYQDSL